jgi:hypothetical protein
MNRLGSLVKVAWFLAAIAALAFHLYVVFFHTAKDSGVVMVWAMIVLTFPLGLLPMFAYGFAAQVSDGAANDLVLWLLMAATGFFQWFWLVPRVFRWVKSRIFASRSS